MIKAIQKYYEMGLNVIPCRGKASIIPWSDYQSNQISADTISSYTNKKFDSCAITCGKGSGNVEVIDVDDPSVIDTLLANISDILENLYEDLWIAQTKSGGYHIYYRCNTIEGNQKLANDADGRVRIETRGQGGYVIAPPSPGYKWVQKNDDILQITEQHRTEILDVCRSYNNYEQYISESVKPKKSRSDVYKLTPWDAYDRTYDFEEILNDAGWTKVKQTDIEDFWLRPGQSSASHSAKFHHEKRTFFIHSTSVQKPLEHGRAYRPSLLRAYLKHGGDLTQNTADLINAGYGEKWSQKSIEYIAKKAQKYVPGDTIKTLLGDNDWSSDKELERMMESVIIKHNTNDGEFWSINNKGKCTIENVKLFDFFKRIGLYKYRYDERSVGYIFIKIDTTNHIIEKLTDDKVKKYVMDSIDDLDVDWVDKMKIKEAWTKKRDIKHLYDFLDEVTDESIEFLRDDIDAAYFTFKNVIVKVTVGGITPLSYSDLDAGVYVWKHNIKDKSVNLYNLKDNKEELLNSVFFKFMMRLSGYEGDINTLRYNTKEYNRLMSLSTYIGYILHTYKDKTRPWAVGITEDTDEAGKGGGTGKGLLLQGLAEARTMITLPGKTWDINNTFSFQALDVGVEIVYIDDVLKRFDFEGFNNVISEDLMIEKKHESSVIIPFRLSPKFVFTTNYAITTNGIHGSRRLKKYSIAKYFTKDFTPFDEFKTIFFEDKNKHWHRQWDIFYNTLFWCVQEYFENSIIEVEDSLGVVRKGLVASFSGAGEQQFEWFEKFYRAYDGKMYSNKMMHEAFTNEVKVNRQSAEAFAHRQKMFCEQYGIEIIKVRKKDGMYYQYSWDSLRFSNDDKVGIKCPKLINISALGMPYDVGEVLVANTENVDIDETPF